MKCKLNIFGVISPITFLLKLSSSLEAGTSSRYSRGLTPILDHVYSFILFFLSHIFSYGSMVTLLYRSTSSCPALQSPLCARLPSFSPSNGGSSLRSLLSLMDMKKY